MVIKFVLVITEVEIVPLNEETPISSAIVFRIMELFSSSVNRDARLLVEVRLLYTVVELPRVVTTKIVSVR